ncbi:hypothetical protein M409DRAFT_48897 [Zasmidium cellare ATCC 36951]|uniref:Ribosomal RNA-processing protein 14/surfeit locus protein 6 C-terminal domain-containing protein n=1 Tax=Zasmidium cellare ATCC 36951 TaxID=1080233 RepID=A0A6A6D6P8_ZASCE|nr:uncharacterized protein M409DRAFT_48897 [Zasmidium cellare ATCC 36951]KAF2174000.1 hypothetical protein M409DRAFT_48897 [Zasmidium cellare ATCC 36951]
MGEQAEDPLDGLEERLQSHAKAFESLLALTPARDHYGSQIDDGHDPSEQWSRKKQTKEQKKAAKKAKLDPANQKSALDVMKERENKRKRELGIADEEQDNDGALEDVASNKRQKKEPAEDEETKRKRMAEKRKEKRQAKNEKKKTLLAKKEAKKAAKQDRDLGEVVAEREQAVAGAEEEENDEDDDEPGQANDTADMDKLDFSGLADSDEEEDHEEDEDEAAEASSAPTSPVVLSPAFDTSTNHSEASSSSSIHPPSTSDESKELTRKQPSSSSSTKPQLKLDLSEKSKASSTSQKSLPDFADPASGTSSPKIQLPDVDPAELQERLRKRIEELRARRKADGGEGKPAKSRQELLEQRRKKEEQRKAHKKELRRQAKEEEARKRDEQLRGSGSPLSTEIFNRNSPRPQDNNFSFSRLAFEDGTAADASLTELQDPRKRKGPQDPRTALEAAEKKQSRLAGLDAEKRADIAEKDMWLNAKKRAHGERVRDDTSLLKKALKRKEKQKTKSEKEWNERKEAVVKGKEAKQKKRETNLQKRREEKGQKGKKKSQGKGKKKARPGFEGRFKA